MQGNDESPSDDLDLFTLEMVQCNFLYLIIISPKASCLLDCSEINGDVLDMNVLLEKFTRWLIDNLALDEVNP